MSLQELSFDRGLEFEKRVWTSLKKPINFVEHQGLREFFLVAEFTKSKICLSDESVAFILLSCFGGRSSLFKVSRLQNLTFKFSVSSMDVGFTIYNEGNIVTPMFSVSFWL